MIPLHHSAANGHLEVCRLLVESKADVAASDRCFIPPPSHHLSLTICFAVLATLHSDMPSTTTRIPMWLHTCAASARRNDALPRLLRPSPPTVNKVLLRVAAAVCQAPLCVAAQQLALATCGDRHTSLIRTGILLGMASKNAPRHTRALSNLHIHGHGTSALSHHQPLCCSNVSRSFMRTNVFCCMVGGAFQASIVFLFYGTRRACKELAPRIFWRENTQSTLLFKINQMLPLSYAPKFQRRGRLRCSIYAHTILPMSLAEPSHDTRRRVTS